MTENTENNKRIKRLLYQSWYRGCKETDGILGYFAKKYIHGFTDEELDTYEEILTESDDDIFHWKSGKQPLPKKYENCNIMKMILSFDSTRA